MKKLFFFNLLMCMACISLAKPMSALPSKLASQSLLTDIVKLNNGDLVAVGDRGHVVLSSDNQTWIQSIAPVNVLLTDVFFLNNHHGWAVGHDVTIIRTVDGGKTWQVQYYAPQIDKPLFGIHFHDNDNGFAFGAYGLFLRTNNGGQTWQKEFRGEFLHPEDLDYINELKATDVQAYEDETSSILPHFNGILIDQKQQYLVGEMGLVATLIADKSQWQKLDTFYNGSFFTITQDDLSGRLFAGGLRGNLFSLTKDQRVKPINEQRWEKLDIGVNFSINQLFTVNNKLVILGNSGLVLVKDINNDVYQSYTQADGKNITAGVVVDDKLILTSQVGIKVINGVSF